MCHISTDFCENWLSSFCVVLLTNKQTNADENITSLAEIIFRIMVRLLDMERSIRSDHGIGYCFAVLSAYINSSVTIVVYGRIGFAFLKKAVPK